MQIGRKSIKNKQGRQSGEMKGGSEGRQMEFSTSVTLAGLSIMCDVVETGRWSESVRVGRLQVRSHVFHWWIHCRIGCSYFCVHNRKHTVELVVFLDIHFLLQRLFPSFALGQEEFSDFNDIALQLLDISVLFMC